MRNLLFLFLIIISNSCLQEAELDQVIHEVIPSNSTFLADGTSSIDIRVKINKRAEKDKRKVIFEASDGHFTGGSKTIEVESKLINDELIATTQITSPMNPTIITVSVRVDLGEIKDEFIYRFDIEAIKSTPNSITLSSNSFSVINNFGGEVELVGSILNNEMKKVSMGSQVVFKDVFSDGTDVNGRFRAEQLSSNSESKVSAIYSPGFISSGQSIFVQAIVLDEDGLESNISDEIEINVISN